MSGVDLVLGVDLVSHVDLVVSGVDLVVSGVDDVFVFINIFRQSTHLKSVKGRLKHTIRTAGVATFYTSITTAMAFASNIASSVSQLIAVDYDYEDL